MSTNPFKAFIPYLVDATPGIATHPFHDHRVTEPSGGDWRRVGLTFPLPIAGAITESLDGNAYLMAVQFNERILPGKVRDEKVSKEVKRLQDAEGRKLSKKEYAQVREQVEFDLLPKAFVRRTIVHVLFFRLGIHTAMLVCTSSQKRADDCVAVLMGAFGDTLRPWKIETTLPIEQRLTTLAKDNYWTEVDYDLPFEPTDCAVLKGGEKRTVRIKDKDISDSDVQSMLEHMVVNELGIQYGDSAENGVTFTLNTNLTFKRITLPDVKTTALKEDFFGFAVLCAGTYKRLLADLLPALGGIKDKPTTSVATPTSASNDDEEL